ncbi:MAG: redoxin domain-containing protein [Chloroflexota bacterium]
MSLLRFPQTKKDWLSVMALAVLMSVGWMAYSRDVELADPNTLATAPMPGALAPDFTLTTLEGESVTLSELRGQPIILNFWATWCGPCRQETPHFQSYYEQNQDDFVMLGINQREAIEQIEGFVDEFGMTYPVLLDENGQVYDAYQVFGLPTTWFVDPDGVLVSVAPGGVSAAYLEDQLERIKN